MSRIFFDIDVESSKVVAGSTFDESDEPPITYSNMILLQGRPLTSCTYALEKVNIRREEEILEMPEKFSARIEQTNDVKQIIGELYFVESFTDREMGVNEPNQFEAIIWYPTQQYQQALTVLEMADLETISSHVSIFSPATENRGYSPVINISRSTYWPIIDFNVSRELKGT